MASKKEFNPFTEENLSRPMPRGITICDFKDFLDNAVANDIKIIYDEDTDTFYTEKK